jgi:DNA-directed RNA polymerase subunit RPC12/RpoP
MSIVQEIKCSHCGAPISFQPGELLATCRYCGFTVVVETGETFNFEHSMILNRFDLNSIEGSIRAWMQEGFLKPSDLAKKSKVTEKELAYLPFWVVSADVSSTYKGVLERIAPAIVKEGKLDKEYNWLVLARKASEFPTREYEVPLAGKIPFDFRKVESFAKVLNSEVDKDMALDLAKQQMEENNRFLLQDDVDKIVEMKTEMKVNQVVYLHGPVWFVKYEYKGQNYRLFVDASTGTAIKGDIPSGGFKIL